MTKRKSSANNNQALPTERYHRKRFALRVGVIAVFVVALCAVLIARFYWLQITQYDNFIEQSNANSLTKLPIAPVRGDIIDRNGVILARNYPAFSLEIVPDELDRPMDEVVAALQQYVDVRPSDMRQFNKFRREYRGLGNIPLKMKLTNDEAQKLAGELFRFKGVEIHARTFREYPHGELTAHFIGYIGRINQKEQDHINENNLAAHYRGATHIGKSGLEFTYENELRGEPGYREAEKFAQGNISRVLRTVPPTAGKTLRLGMDFRVQQKADEILGNNRGAIIALDPKTGDVLAYISKPSFNPNLFINGIDSDTWKTLNEDWQKPLINRVTQALYPPGSTFKPFMAMALLESGTLKENTLVSAPGAWSIPGTSHVFRAEGTTPRRLTDLIGSLCDLTSGSGDKGTPIVYIQGYFDNYTTD
ncbi:MAG: coenzyme F420-0:L-glutamate ligase [Neisseriaceae bacterium]|nr:coenzyme F420-0:L-glutamate ligase [Neisseriaceae bacterium]